MSESLSSANHTAEAPTNAQAKRWEPIRVTAHGELVPKNPPGIGWYFRMFGDYATRLIRTYYNSDVPCSACGNTVLRIGDNSCVDCQPPEVVEKPKRTPAQRKHQHRNNIASQYRTEAHRLFRAGHSAHEVADQTGCSVVTAYKFRNEVALEYRDKGETPPENLLGRVGKASSIRGL